MWRPLILGALVAALIAVPVAASANGWGQTKVGAENNLRGYRLSGHTASSVRCVGIWSSGARRQPTGSYLFARLWCELRFPSAYWHVKYEQTGRNAYKLIEWACGRIGGTCSPSGAGTSARCTANGHPFYLSGVLCDAATAVYFAYISGGYTHAWTCTGSASFGSCSNGSGLSIDQYASFRWN